MTTATATNVIDLAFERHRLHAMKRGELLWFVLADVCEILGIVNHRDAASRLDDDQKGVANADTLGGVQSMTIISEDGVYDLATTSRKPIAKRFKRWLYREVLPEIRRTGSYQGGAAPLDELIGTLQPELPLTPASTNVAPPAKQRPEYWCREEWMRLPLALRQKWWRETDYGKRPPSEALVEECKIALERAIHHKIQRSLDLVAEPNYDANVDDPEHESNREQWQDEHAGVAYDCVVRTEQGPPFLRIMRAEDVETVPRLQHMFYLPMVPQLTVMLYGDNVPTEVIRTALARKKWDTPLVLATLKNLLD